MQDEGPEAAEIGDDRFSGHAHGHECQRVLVLSWRNNTNAVANAIRERKSHQIPSMMQTSRGLGMRTLNDALTELVKQGIVAPEEAVDKSLERTLLVKELRNQGITVNYVEEDKSPGHR